MHAAHSDQLSVVEVTIYMESNLHDDMLFRHDWLISKFNLNKNIVFCKLLCFATLW